MGAEGDYSKSKRDGEAIMERDTWTAKGEEKSDRKQGVGGMIVL